MSGETMRCAYCGDDFAYDGRLYAECNRCVIYNSTAAREVSRWERFKHWLRCKPVTISINMRTGRVACGCGFEYTRTVPAQYEIQPLSGTPHVA